MTYPYEEVGARIAFVRKQRGFSKERLAELADISVQFLSDIEKGRKNMTVTTLRKCAAALSVTTDYIVNGTVSGGNGQDELVALFAALPEDKRRYAADLLRILNNAIK